MAVSEGDYLEILHVTELWGVEIHVPPRQLDKVKEYFDSLYIHIYGLKSG